VPDLTVRQIPIAATRPLRQSILRPHQTLEALAAHEPPDAYAVGVFRERDLIAVGFIAPDGEQGSWRIRGMATVATARGGGGGTAGRDPGVSNPRENTGTRGWC
jgi:hypothetical protein